jgi:hypothetical protein
VLGKFGVFPFTFLSSAHVPLASMLKLVASLRREPADDSDGVRVRSLTIGDAGRAVRGHDAAFCVARSDIGRDDCVGFHSDRDTWLPSELISQQAA